jgi:hypothetical protein
MEEVFPEWKRVSEGRRARFSTPRAARPERTNDGSGGGGGGANATAPSRLSSPKEAYSGRVYQRAIASLNGQEHDLTVQDAQLVRAVDRPGR